jgi:hypothetical protein
VQICNGQLFETVTDGGATTTLGMYPRQPFDIGGGRTGTVVFDVSADSQCTHCAWPAFVYTDQPVPAPYNGQGAPRNSFGFALDATVACNSQALTTVGEMWITQNYQTSFINFGGTGCVTKGVAGGPLNHFEVRMSQSHVEVWATDPGQSNLHSIAVANVNMPLTRGLVWMEDVHYNANKDSNQGTHTFAWANFGFDGPILPRDLGFDVKDAQNSGGSSPEQLGYMVFFQNTLQINNVTGINNASAALLEFTFTPHAQFAINYSLNGHPAHSMPWPYGANAATYQMKTIALPVPLNELVSGTNSFTISSTPQDIFDIANIDLILVGAGGTVNPGSSPPPPPPPPPASNTPVPPTPIPAATNTPVPVSTPIPPTSTPTRAPIPPTSTPTRTPIPPTPVPPTPVPPTPVPPTPIPQTSGAPKFIQANNAVPQSPQSVVRVAYANAQAAGNTDIVAVGWNDTTGNLTAVSDSIGNAYRVAVQPAQGKKLRQAIIYASNTKPAAPGSNIVTVTFDRPVAYPDIRILEYSGLDRNNPFDTGVSASGNGGGTASSGNLTTRFANSIVIGAGMTNGGFTGAGQGYAMRVMTSPDADMVEDRPASTTGTYAATAPVNDVWLMQAAAFHGPTGPAPAP